MFEWTIPLRLVYTVLYHRFTYAAWKLFTLWERPLACRLSEVVVESRQFIGWWCDTAPHELTSSAYTAYTGEHVIYSSHFSAFTKRQYCPSVVIFLAKYYILRTRILRLHFGDCLQWNFVLLAVKCHGISPLSTAVCSIYRERWPA